MGFIKAMLLGPFSHHRLVAWSADLKPADLATLAALMQAGKIKSIIDRRYPLSEISSAIDYVEAGHARAKVVVDVD